MDCGLDSTTKCMCVWWVVQVRIVVWSWDGGVWRRKEEEPQKEPGVSNTGSWLDTDVIYQYIKNTWWESRLGEEHSERSFRYVGLS